MTVYQIIAIPGMIAGLVVAASPWWWPWIKGRLRYNGPKATGNATSAVLDADVERLKKLTLLIEKHAEWFQPLGVVGNRRAFNPVAFHADDGKLKFYLEELQIPYPKNFSNAQCSRYWRYLTPLARDGRLEDARSLYRDMV